MRKKKKMTQMRRYVAGDFFVFNSTDLVTPCTKHLVPVDIFQTLQDKNDTSSNTAQLASLKSGKSWSYPNMS